MDWSLTSLEKHLLIGSTLVEGSTLTETQAAEVLAGQTVSGHPISELREMKELKEALSDRVVDQLRDEIARGRFPSITFDQAMAFILTNGILPAAGLPVASFLALEDWLRAASERED